MISRSTNYLIVTFGLLFISFLFWTGCRHDPWLPDTMSDLCFDKDIRPIMLSNCAYSGCHDSQSHEHDVDLSSFSAVISSDVLTPGNANKSDLYKVLLKSGSSQMPPTPLAKLTKENQELIRIWIEQGARNNCPVEICDSSNVTFTSFIVPLKTAYCISCHKPPSPSGGISLGTYAEVKAIGTNGSFVGALSGAPGYHLMPPGASLSACDIAKVKKWIREGYIN